MRNNLTKFDKIICLLALASLVLYGLDYLFYGRAAEIGFGFLGNLAFLPIYVLFVTLMIERILKEREQSSIRQKLNMVIGVFFSEVGTSLLKDCFGFLRNGSELAGQVRITPQWQNQDFARLADLVKGYDFAFDCSSGDLDSLKHFVETHGFASRTYAGSVSAARNCRPVGPIGRTQDHGLGDRRSQGHRRRAGARQ